MVASSGVNSIIVLKSPVSATTDVTAFNASSWLVIFCFFGGMVLGA